MEIERKFLLTGFPGYYPPKHTYRIKQSYLSIEPEVRIRQSIASQGSQAMSPYKMTIKGNGTLIREEIEEEISADFYNQLIKFIKKPPIIKDFHLYSFDGKEIEISHVDNSFYYGEVEFNTLEEANDFIWPWKDILVSEITEDSSYKMKNYWAKTRG